MVASTARASMGALHGGDFDVVNATVGGLNLLQRHRAAIGVQYA
jgi:hypothetical protein